MRVSCGIRSSAVAVAAMLAFAMPALAEPELYQWVDSSGNVIYGDSPPNVTHSRKVESTSAEEQLLAVPNYLLTVPQGAEQVAESPQSPEEQAALLEALNRLQSMMTKMEDLTSQVDKLESKNDELEAKVLQDKQSRELARKAVELAVQSPANTLEPTREDTVTTTSPVQFATTKPALVPLEATPSQPLVSDPQPIQQQKVANSIEATPVEPADVNASKSAAATEVASFHREELDGEAIIGSQPLLEVAAPEPQPIKSQMSAKERDRSRWQAQNRAQQRFLERLSKKANNNPTTD